MIYFIAKFIALSFWKKMCFLVPLLNSWQSAFFYPNFRRTNKIGQSAIFRMSRTYNNIISIESDIIKA